MRRWGSGSFRSVLLTALLAVLLVVLLVGAGSCAGPNPRPVRIVLITLDTLRWDSFAGAPGRPSDMPELRRWAADATLFERFFSASGTTQPAHASLFLGTHPWQHGVTRNGMGLPPTPPTLAERLRDAGYATAATVASFPVSAHFGFDRGFERFEDRFETGRIGGRAAEGMAHEHFWSSAEIVTRRALEMIDSAHAPRQFFWFHYFDPHSPYGDRQPTGGVVPKAALDLAAEGEDPAEAVRRARELYDQDVRFLDRSLAQVLLRLSEESREISTHVLIVADHGESFGEDGSMGHGRRLTAGPIHVLCLLDSPSVEAGIRRDVAGTIDLAPTILSLASLPVEGLEGRNLTRSIGARRVQGMRRTFEGAYEDRRLDGRTVLLEGDLFYATDREGRVFRGNSTSVLPPWTTPGADAGPGDPDLHEPLKELFASFEAELQRTQTKADAPADADDPETKEALRALGYAG